MCQPARPFFPTAIRFSNLDNLRIDPGYLHQPAAKKLLTTVPVRKPGKQDFFRVHPRESYRLLSALIELRDERETYLVVARVVQELSDGEFFFATLYLCINRQKVVLALGSGADAGKLVLLAAASEASAYGVLLDPAIDTAAAFGDGSVTGSVAKAGTFRGAALIDPTGINAATVTTRLRELGIFTEGPITVPAAAAVLEGEPEAVTAE